MQKQLKFIYEFGPFLFAPEQNLLLRDGKTVPLTAKGFEILHVLIRNSGFIVGKEGLMNEVWPDTFVEESNLTQNISILRKALGESRKNPQYIETVQGRGYRFIAPVKAVDDILDPLAQQHRGIHSEGQGRSVHPDKSISAIAVLPLANRSNQPDMEYLSEGMTESLINALSQLPGLRVMAYSSVSRFKGEAVDLKEVGRELNVQAVITGSVLAVDGELIAGAEMVDLSDGSQVWGERYHLKLDNLFDVQTEISRRITDKLQIASTSEERQRIFKYYTENAEAYHAYLRGRYFFNKRNPESFKKAVRCFQKALEMDANYALALAGLADCYNLFGDYHMLRPKEAFERAKRAALDALEIDPLLSEAHASLALSKSHYDWDWAGAENEFRRAIELNPNYAPAYMWFGRLLTKLARFGEGLVETMKAQRLDPLSPVISAHLGFIYYVAGEYDLAVEKCLEALEIDPGLGNAHGTLALIFQQQGSYKEAIKHIRQGMSLGFADDPEAKAFLGYLQATSGNRGEALGVINELKAQSEQRYIPPFFIAMIYIGLKEKDSAFEWLERAYTERSDSMGYLNVFPVLDSLRADSRFADLLRRVGFSE